MILAQLAHYASHAASSLAFFQEDQTTGFSPLQLWGHMAWMARTVAIVLFIESIWSLAVMIDRYLYFSAARKQSREFAPKVAGGISEALVTTAFGLLVAIPAVMAFNYFTGRVEAFDVEMDNSSSELIDYFIKQSHKR